MNRLLKLFKPESLARARKRIKANLKQSHSILVYRNIFRDGTQGYERETYVYGEAR
jgi:hypothetical protein